MISPPTPIDNQGIAPLFAPGLVVERSSHRGPVRTRMGHVMVRPLEHTPPAGDPGTAFTVFVESEGIRLRKVLTARYGVEVGGDIYADTLAWAWENWARLEAMDNPVGYLYRVGQSSARPHRRWMSRNSFPARMPERWHLDQDPTLLESLKGLPEAQRVAVLMVHGHKWTYAEVAEALGCSVAAVTNHVHRGLAALRRQLETEQL